jgi:hypothetical protein
LPFCKKKKNAECDGNPFTDNFDKYHCKNCYTGIKSFLQLPNIKQIFQKHYVPFENVYKRVYEADPANLINDNQSARANNKEDQENLIKKAWFQENDADPWYISAIKEELRQSLLSVASKLLTEQHLTLDQLSQEEQDLWNSYDNRDIYEFLTGEKDTHPEFRFDWIVTDPKLRWSDDWRNLIPPQPQAKPPPAPPLPVQPLPPPNQDQAPPEAPQQPPARRATPVVVQSDRVLRNKPAVDYKELHTGIKRKCKTLRQKATAVVTKLAPGAFSPRRTNPGDGPSTSASQQ